MWSQLRKERFRKKGNSSFIPTVQSLRIFMCWAPATSRLSRGVQSTNWETSREFSPSCCSTTLRAQKSLTEFSTLPSLLMSLFRNYRKKISTSWSWNTFSIVTKSTIRLLATVFQSRTRVLSKKRKRKVLRTTGMSSRRSQTLRDSITTSALSLRISTSFKTRMIWRKAHYQCYEMYFHLMKVLFDEIR